MREYEEVGKFANFSDKANEAYRTYASVYLDFVDDNIGHFLWRDVDVSPVMEIKSEEEGNEHFQEDVYEAYLNVALDIVAIALNSGCGTIEEIYQRYPLLKEKADELKEALKKKQETKGCEAHECFAI